MPDYERVKELLNEALEELEDAPAPPSTHGFKITVGKANARCIYGYNKAGKPMWGIYPKGGEPSERVQWLQGRVIAVLPSSIIGDGGGRCYELVEKAPDGSTIYVRSEDGVLV